MIVQLPELTTECKSRTLQFAFGCHHRHLSRVFTIKQRTCRVCLDCGQEFELLDVPAPSAVQRPRYSWRELRTMTGVNSTAHDRTSCTNPGVIRARRREVT
jgi:hypothetical protein